MTAKVIYSGGADLDILPQHASKGKGLEFLLGEVSSCQLLGRSCTCSMAARAGMLPDRYATSLHKLSHHLDHYFSAHMPTTAACVKHGGMMLWYHTTMFSSGGLPTGCRLAGRSLP